MTIKGAVGANRSFSNRQGRVAVQQNIGIWLNDKFPFDNDEVSSAVVRSPEKESGNRVEVKHSLSEESPRGNNMDIRSEIETQFKRVAEEQGRKIAPLRENLALLDSGLDSLSFAILVARLEDLFGVDPFSIAEDAQFPVTFGDLVELYEKAANQPQ